MIRDYCDNTDCEAGKEILYKVELRKEFESTICYWCRYCIERDKDMIENILYRDNSINYHLNEKFDIR